MNYKLYNLDNGLKLLFVPNKKIKLIYVSIDIKIGSDTENVKTLEISHFIEHLFTLLTSNKYSDALENRNLLSKLNIDYNAEVITKHTNFHYVLKKKYLNILIDMICHSLYDFKIHDTLFKNEKNSVIEELNSITNDTDYKFETFIDEKLYKNHTRKYTQVARLNNVIKVKPQDIEKYFKEYYTPKNMVISFFGDVDQKKVISSFNTIISKFGVKNISNSKLYKEEDIFKMNLRQKVFFLKERKQTCNIKIMFNIPYTFFDDEYYTIFSILNILTFDLSSILIDRLRNKEGLIYDLHGQMDLDENTNQLSFVYFETNASSENIVKIIKIILEELKNLRQGKIEQEQINKYKESLKIKEIRDKLTFHPLKLLDEYSKYALWDKKIIKFNDEFKYFANISKSKISKVSKKIFNINKISIFYNGVKDCNNEIKKLL